VIRGWVADKLWAFVQLAHAMLHPGTCLGQAAVARHVCKKVATGKGFALTVLDPCLDWGFPSGLHPWVVAGCCLFFRLTPAASAGLTAGLCLCNSCSHNFLLPCLSGSGSRQQPILRACREQ